VKLTGRSGNSEDPDCPVIKPGLGGPAIVE
jgi:hypothetical protein